MIGPVRGCVFEFDDHTDSDDHSQCDSMLAQMYGPPPEIYWDTNPLSSTSYMAYLNRGY